MRVSILTVIAAGLLGLAGCQTGVAPQGYAPDPSLPYLLDSGDRLRVLVYGADDISNVYEVDPSGYVAIPLIGAVPVRGTSIGETEESITARLRSGYIRNPDVSVEIAQYRPFYILGEVQSAGRYPYSPGLTVESAIAVAGGFTPRAHRKRVRVSRMINGKIIHGELGLTDIIRAGDTLHIRERLF